MEENNAPAEWSAWKIWRHPKLAKAAFCLYADKLSDSEVEISRLNTELTDAAQQIESLSKALAEERKGNVEMLQELSAVGIRESKAQTDLKAALLSIHTIKTELADAQQLHTDIKAEMDRLREALAVARGKITDLSIELTTAETDKAAAKREAQKYFSDLRLMSKDSTPAHSDAPAAADDSDWLEDIPEEFR